MEENQVQEGKEGMEEMEIVVRNEKPDRRDAILPISILIAALFIGGAIVFATLYHPNSGAAGPNAGAQGANGNPAAGTLSTASTSAILALGPRDAILGNKNAPVTIIEYGDYQCPFCAQYFENVEPSLVKNYINTGKAKLVFRNFAFLGPESIAAAEAAECAQDQGQLWAFHDALYTAKYQDFQKNGTEDDGVLNRTLFLNIAQQLHLNIPQFTSCIDSNQYASLVAQEKSDAVAIGVDSTPSTLVNGVLVTDGTGQSVGADGNAILQAVAQAAAK